MVPVIAAIYFIITSFRTSLYENQEGSHVSSIKNKMAVAFVFVAVLPSFSLMLASQNYYNNKLDLLISPDTEEVLKLTNDSFGYNIKRNKNLLLKEMNFFQSLQKKGVINLESRLKNESIITTYKKKKIKLHIFDSIPYKKDDLGKSLYGFYRSHNYKTTPWNRLTVKGDEYLCATLSQSKKRTVVFTMKLPKDNDPLIKKVQQTVKSYYHLVGFRNSLQSSSASFWLAISVIIVVISVIISIILSENIVNPVLEIVHASQRVAHGDFSVKLKRSVDDELTLLYNSFNDMVSDLKLNQDLTFQKQRLEAWRDVARKLVHEIKNPLTPIRLSAERIQRRYIENHENIGTIIQSGTESIKKEVEVLIKLLDEFTLFARLPEMKREDHDIMKVIRSCGELYENHEEITVEIHEGDNIPPFIFDALLMKQAFVNLFKNAVEAMAGKGKISIDVDYNNDTLYIDITDSGHGVPHGYVKKIFEPGFSQNKKGSGLGLAITKKIILEHEGVINYRENISGGASFRIEFPITKEVDKNGNNSHS